MANKTLIWISSILFIIVLAGVFFAGYFTYKGKHPCIVSTSDTIYVHDTVKHTIINKVPYYIQKLDTVFSPSDTVFITDDSVEIKFYSTYQYTRTFEDSTIKAVLEDRVTQNKPSVNSFDYTIKRPMQVIQNIDKSVNYSRYVYVSGTLAYPDPKYSSVGVIYASQRTILGVGYIPLIKGGGFEITAGFTLFKIK